MQSASGGCVPVRVSTPVTDSKPHEGKCSMSSSSHHRPPHARPPRFQPKWGPPRFQQGPVTTALHLGPLAFLPGAWTGTGFNAIWRPDNSKPPENSLVHRFLELNLTNDSFDFQVIPGVVPNRGLNEQEDLNLYGLHYLQRVSDADPAPSPTVLPAGYSQTAGQALHIEPGLFMKVPGGSQVENVPGIEGTLDQSTIVRMASIPHGVTVMMRGPDPGSKPIPGGPNIPALLPFAGYDPPFPVPGTNPLPPGVGILPIGFNGAVHNVLEVDISQDLLAPASQSTGPYPAAFQGFIDDPNSVLREAIAGQQILGTITISLTTDTQSPNGVPTFGVGSGLEAISNIPFLGIANPDPPIPPPLSQPAAAATQNNTTPNAFVYSASATFWIEWVRVPFEAPPILPGQPHRPPPGDPLWLIEPFWGEQTFLQLQYSQLVILIFNGFLWPHVSVGTLTLSAG
jgi:hypothetical protein